MGWSREEAVGRNFHELVRHRDAEGVEIPREMCPLERVAVTGEPVTGDGDLFARRDGTDICVTFTGAPITDPDGDLHGIVIATDGVIMDANDAAQALTGIPIDSSRGKPFTEFLDPRDVETAMTLFGEVLEGEARRATLRLLRADGSFLAAHVVGVPILVDDKVVGVHGVLRRA